MFLKTYPLIYSFDGYVSHIHDVHSDVLSIPMTAMHRRRVAKGMSMAADEFNPQEDQSFRVLVQNKPASLVTMNKVTMIKNQRGIDCFAISILHLFGQTDFVRYGLSQVTQFRLYSIYVLR